MIRIKNIEKEYPENEGCNNGNYSKFVVKFEDGTEYKGITCRCCSGCSGTDRINHLSIGDTFYSLDDFLEGVEAEY